MPHHKSAKKRVRQTKRRTLLNRFASSANRTAIKKLYLAISGKDKGKALELFPLAQSLLARLAKRGVIKTNTAARKTQRLAAQISKI